MRGSHAYREDSIYRKRGARPAAPVHLPLSKYQFRITLYMAGWDLCFPAAHSWPRAFW